MIASRSRWTVVSRAALLVSIVMLVVAASPDLAIAQRLNGKISDGRYTSQRALLTVPVPQAGNWAGVPFQVLDVTETGEVNYESVAFYVPDFGEVLLASVRRIPQSIVDVMDTDDPQVVLRALADKALADWRDLASEPEMVAEEFVATSYGEAAVRVYNVAKGSLLQRTVPGSNQPPESFDALIAVIAARRNNQMISAIAEDDGARLESLQGRLRELCGELEWKPVECTSLEVEDRGDRLKARVLEFFGGVVVPATATFE